jgi:heme A synthase
MRFDQSQGFTAGYLLPPAAYDADNSPATFSIGTAQAATILLQVGAGGITFSSTNKIEFVLTHSDSATSGFEPVTQGDVVGVTVLEGGIVRALTAAHATPSVTVIGYRGLKPHLRLLADFSGTHGTATPLSAAVVRGILDRVAA